LYSNESLLGNQGKKTARIAVTNLKVFFKKSKFSRFTILRAPYRYKKGRYQIGFKRYESLVSFTLEMPCIENLKS